MIELDQPEDGVFAEKADLGIAFAPAGTKLEHGRFAAEGSMPTTYGLPAIAQVKDHHAAIDAIIRAWRRRWNTSVLHPI